MSLQEATRSIEFRACCHAQGLPIQQTNDPLRFAARFPQRFDAESFARTAGTFGATSRPVYTRKGWLVEADLRSLKEGE